MKLMTFAAGLAAGYVLGARAGREKYEQITAAFDRARHHPALPSAGPATSDRVTGPATSDRVTSAAEATTPTAGDRQVDSPGIASPVGPSPRPRRKGTKATVTVPSVTADPAPEV